MSYTIAYPKKQSEFEIQANLFCTLKYNHKINVRGEVIDKQLKSKFNKSGFQVCRFDLVVFDSNNLPLCIIEVKKEGKKINLLNRQSTKYNYFGVKLLFCNSMLEITNTANKVLDMITEYKITS